MKIYESYGFKSPGYSDGSNMDDGFSYFADIINCDDNRTFHRNFADSDFDSGTDFDFYTENSCCLSLHNIIISMDRTENVSYDARNSGTA